MHTAYTAAYLAAMSARARAHRFGMRRVVGVSGLLNARTNMAVATC
ncbi:hypothetical protein [Roseiarcus sp.]